MKKNINYFDTPNQRRQNETRVYGKEIKDPNLVEQPIINPIPEGNAHARLHAELRKDKRYTKI